MMKKTLALLTVLCLLLCSLPGAFAGNGEAPALRLAVATDMHYLSPRLVEGGELIRQAAENGDGKMMHLSEHITDAFFAGMKAAKPDALILSGDLTLNGGTASHEDFAAKLKELEQSGINLLVIPGNHDIDMEYAINYADTGAEKAPALSFEEFCSLYGDFGPDLALSRDEYTFSYTVQLAEELRLIMLDTNSYGTGTIKSSTLEWLEGQLKEAQAAGAEVITVSHQNLYAHNRLLSFGYRLYNADKLLALLEEYGVLCHLSGHIHSQSVYESAVPEIVTSSLTVSPAQYGVLEYDGSSLEYRCVETDVASWAADMGRGEPELVDFAAYARRFFADNCRRQVGEMYEGTEMSEEDISALAECFAALNQAYFAGEKPEHEALLPGVELWRAQEKNFTQMYIETMYAVDKDSRSYVISLN